MALKIRLARGGSKKRPYYHVVIADARKHQICTTRRSLYRARWLLEPNACKR